MTIPDSEGRVVRPFAPRSEPLRDLRHAFRGAGPAGQFIDAAVDNAYRVFDEYVRRGKESAARRAEGQGPGLPFSVPPALEPQLVAGQVFRLWQGMARQWLGLWSPLLPGIEGLVAGLPTAAAQGGASGAGPSSAGWAFEAERPMRVSLRLFQPETGTLSATLHGPGTGAGLVVEVDAAAPKLKLPAALPAGRYEGVVNDRAGALVGALSVELLPNAAEG